MIGHEKSPFSGRWLIGQVRTVQSEKGPNDAELLGGWEGPEGGLPDQAPLFEPPIHGGLGDAEPFMICDMQADLPGRPLGEEGGVFQDLVHLMGQELIPGSRPMGLGILEALGPQLPKSAFPAIVRASRYIILGQGIGEARLGALNQTNELELVVPAHSLVPPSTAGRNFFYTSGHPGSPRRGTA